jgi:hypothetical protein
MTAKQNQPPNGTTSRPTAPGRDPDRLDPATASVIVAEQRASARRALIVDARILYGIWALAWVIAYGALWISSRPAPTAWPPAWGWVIFAAVLVAAVGATIAHQVARGYAVKSAGKTNYTAWGWAWAIAFGGGMTAASAIARELDSVPLSIAFYNAVAALIVGCLYLAAGAMTTNWAMYVIGGWLIVITTAATYAALQSGPAASYLVMGLGGGGGLAVGVLAAHLHSRRGR